MTTKEFNRRCAFYAVFESAAALFAFPEKEFVYRVTVVDSLGSKRVFFHGMPSIVVPESLMDCKCIYFDKFTRSDFDIQRKYFLSFISRCSKFQLEIIRSRQLFPFLLNNNAGC